MKPSMAWVGRVKTTTVNLKLDPPNHLIGQALGGKSAWGQSPTQHQPAASLNRRFSVSSINALINLVVWCRLRRQVPVRLDLHNDSNARFRGGSSAKQALNK